MRKVIFSTDHRKGFTLLELLIAIIILGVLASLISGNFLTSLKKGRDTRRKADLRNIQNALELYFEDNRVYPNTLPFGNQLCHPNGCPTKVYMQLLPEDPNGAYTYEYQSTGTDYKLYSCIENELDKGPGVILSGYSGTNCNCGGATAACKFGVSSTNTNP